MSAVKRIVRRARTHLLFIYLPPGAIPQAPIRTLNVVHFSVFSLFKVPEANPVPHCMICIKQIRSSKWNRFHDRDR